MRTQKYCKNKKVKNMRSKSKKGAGLFNTQKILDIPQCQPVKSGNFDNVNSDDAFRLYYKCCPKASLSGKANYNEKCIQLYDVYLNQQKYIKNKIQEITKETNYDYNDNHVLYEKFMNALIAEQSNTTLDLSGGPRNFNLIVPKNEIPKSKKWWRFGFGGKKIMHKTKKILRKKH